MPSVPAQDVPKTRRISYLLAVLLAACGSTGAAPDGAPTAEAIDRDSDGFPVEMGDCNDGDPDIHPEAPDPCDGIDQNCDGHIDEAYDADGDNVSVCQHDCADNDPDSYPGARELPDGRDNDCDDLVDNHIESYDDDGDGYADDQGDCDDEEALVNPSAMEVQTTLDGELEGIDNDCDGDIDEPTIDCAALGHYDANDAIDYVQAIGLCDRVLSASFEAPTDARARGIVTKYGDHYVPPSGATMIALSTGIVGDEQSAAYPGLPDVILSDENVHLHPAPSGTPSCGGADPATVNDYAELRLELQVPSNAKSLSFDFNFMSLEYPEWVCSAYDDTFVALLDSEAFKGNVSFDSLGNPVSINAAFFTVCDTGPGCTDGAELDGTGYGLGEGGGTGWLTTTTPVEPGEKVLMRFVIFDEGDWSLDSVVLIDNFRWHLEAVDEPVTVP